MKLIKFKLGIIALFVTLISILFTGCSDQYEVAKKQGIVFSEDGTVLIECKDKNITKCVIPKGVTRIGNVAFGGCSNLQSVVIPNSVTTIEYSAFLLCSNLQSVTIPNSVTKIEDWAFRYCSNLKEVRVPKNCKIGSGAFQDSCKVIRY